MSLGRDDWPDSDAWEIGFHQEPEDECHDEDCGWCGGALVDSEWGLICDSCGRRHEGGDHR